MNFNNLGNNYAFKHANQEQAEYTGYETCTKSGIGIKTTLLVFITFISAVAMMVNLDRLGGAALIFYGVVAVVNFILQLIICFVPKTTKVLSIPYAIFEGLLIGVLVGLIELVLPGSGYQIGLLALVMTIAIFLAAAILYSSGVIKVTNKFRTFMFVSLLGIVIGSFAVAIMSLFIPGLFALIQSEQLSLIVAIILVVFAGLYVTISLDNANKMVESNLPKQYEWYAAYGILINLVWLFLEVLRLLLILASKNND